MPEGFVLFPRAINPGIWLSCMVSIPISVDCKDWIHTKEVRSLRSTPSSVERSIEPAPIRGSLSSSGTWHSGAKESSRSGGVCCKGAAWGNRLPWNLGWTTYLRSWANPTIKELSGSRTPQFELRTTWSTAVHVIAFQSILRIIWLQPYSRSFPPSDSAKAKLAAVLNWSTFVIYFVYFLVFDKFVFFPLFVYFVTVMFIKRYGVFMPEYRAFPHQILH